MTADLELKIGGLVDAYKKLFPDEYRRFCEQQKVRRTNLKNKWSEIKGTDYMVREMCRYPETLMTIFKRHLDTDEYLEWREIKSQEWMGRAYKEFSMQSL